jgi:RHS repeat-associated protein
MGTISSSDSRTGLVTTSIYRTAPGFIGLLANQNAALNGATVTSHSIVYGGTFKLNLPIVVRQQLQILVRYDLDGTEFPQVDTSYGYDDYNNPTTIERDVYGSGGTVVGKTIVTNQFNNVTDSGQWIIGEITESDTETVVTGGADITRHTKFTPDAPTGRVLNSIVEPGNANLQLESDYGYDTFGNIQSVEQIGRDITTRTSYLYYDTTRGQFPLTATNAMTQSSGLTFGPGFGNLTTITDPNSVTVTSGLDPLGRPSIVTNPDGTSTVTTYTFCSGVNGGTAVCPATGAYLVTVTPKDKNGSADGATTVTYYDALDRPIATDTQGFDGSTVRASSVYDDSTGRLSKSSRPFFLTGGTPQYTQYNYDVLNRLANVTFPDTSQTSYCYHGLTTSTTNDKGQTKTVVNNYMNLLATVIDNASAACSTTGGVATSYTYDGFGDPLTITDSHSHTITNVFDTLGHKTQSTDPDMGHWTYGYDQLGELLTQTDANTNATSLQYDTLQRPTLRTEADLISRWNYDPTGGIGKLANACIGSSCAGAVYQQKPAYDTDGRIATGKLVLDGTTYTYTPSYDPTTGRLATLAYPSGFTAKYVYNTQGYLSQIQDNATSAILWTANTADAELHITQQKAGNNVTTNAGFDAATGNLTSLCASTPAGGCGVANLSYQWDSIGNLSQRKDVSRYTESFCYDALNRVTNYALGTSCTGSGTTTVAYDDTGNITEKSDICAAANCFQYGSGAGPHALTSIVGTYNGVTNPTFAYDANGNMTSGGGRTITPTSFNMASSIVQGANSIALAYGAWHSRYKMCVPDCTAPASTTYYLYDPATGGMSEKVVTSSSTTWKDYIVAPGAGLVAVRSKTGSTVSLRYIVTDHLGSVTSVSDTATPVSIEHDSYDTWGMRRNANGTAAACGTITSQTTRGYTSQEMLDSVCLIINMNARIYDPSLGRFMSADSLIPDPTYSQSYNRYSYVLNNPLEYTDPTGHANPCLVDPKPGCAFHVTGGGPMPCWDCYGPGFDPNLGGYIANYDWSSENWGKEAGYWQYSTESDTIGYDSSGMSIENVVINQIFIPYVQSNVEINWGIQNIASPTIAANDNGKKKGKRGPSARCPGLNQECGAPNSGGLHPDYPGVCDDCLRKGGEWPVPPDTSGSEMTIVGGVVVIGGVVVGVLLAPEVTVPLLLFSIP